MHDYDWKIRRGNDETAQITPISSPTQVIPVINREEVEFRTRKAREYKPGPVMKVFGWIFAVMFALFCLGIIGITFAYTLLRYYHHMFN